MILVRIGRTVTTVVEDILVRVRDQLVEVREVLSQEKNTSQRAVNFASTTSCEIQNLVKSTEVT